MRSSRRRGAGRQPRALEASSAGPAGTRSCQGMQSDLAAELINHAFAFEAGEAKVQHDSG